MEEVAGDDEMPLPPLDGSIAAGMYNLLRYYIKLLLYISCNIMCASDSVTRTPGSPQQKSSLPTTQLENDRNQKKVAAMKDTCAAKIEHCASVSERPNMPPDTPSPVRVQRMAHNIHSIDQVRIILLSYKLSASVKVNVALSDVF